MSYTTLLTVAGKQKYEAALAGGPPITLAQVRLGDASMAPYMPVENQTALVNEKYAAPVISVSLPVTGGILVEVEIPADTNDGNGRPSHGFNINELGVFDNTGTLIAVARMNGGYKPSPASGQAEGITLLVEIAISNVNAVTFILSPQTQIHLGRLTLLPFIAIVSDIATVPPANPVVGQTWLVPPAATGVFAGQTGKLMHWTGAAFAILDPPISTVIQVSSRALNDASRFQRKTSALGWSAANATDIQFGFARKATAAEIAAFSTVNAYVTPADVAAAKSYMANSLAMTASGNFVVPEGVTSLEVELWGGGGGGGASANGSAGGLAGNGGSGGGGGGYTRKRITGLVPGQVIPCIIGAGGVGVAANSGTNGTSTSFGGYASASAGAGGSWGENASAIGGIGGAGTGGDIIINGGYGGYAGNATVATPTQSQIQRVYYQGGQSAGGLCVQSFAGSGGGGQGKGGGGGGATGGSGLAGGNGAPGYIFVRW